MTRISALGRFELRDIVVAALLLILTGVLLPWISQLIAGRPGRSRNLPPGPKGWPLVGALPYVGKFPHRSFYELSQKYGPVMFMRLGTVSALVVSNAELAKEVLQTKDQHFASRLHMIIPNFITYGNQGIVFTPMGPHWRRARKITNLQLLAPHRVLHFMGIVRDEILNTIQFVLKRSHTGGTDDKTINIGTIFNGMSMNVITRMMWNRRHRNLEYGQSHEDEKFKALFKTVVELAGANNVADFLPSSLKPLAMKLSGLEGRVKDVHRDLDEFLETIIRDKEHALTNESQGAAEEDFITVMLKLAKQPGDYEGLPRDAIKAIVNDMVLAGTDTTSVALEWALTELLKHPDEMKKAQDELATFVEDDRLVTESDISNLKYLSAVVKETLRRHNVVPILIHFSERDSQVGGYDVPSDSTVFINNFAIHHDPEVWENPWEFNPDRFLASEVDYRGRDFDFIPFGSGRRACPGMSFASNVLHIALAQFLHSVQWSLPEGQTPEDLDVSERSGIILSKANPLLVRVEPRLKHDVIAPPVA